MLREGVLQDQVALFIYDRRAAVGVQGQLPARVTLLVAGVADERLGKRVRIAVGDHPADHVAAKNAEDDVEVEMRGLAMFMARIFLMAAAGTGSEIRLIVCPRQRAARELGPVDGGRHFSLASTQGQFL